MKILLLGGTGTISTEVSKKLTEDGHELWLFNRGKRNRELPGGVRLLVGDIRDEERTAALLGNQTFDAVADFIAYTPEHLERDFRLFRGRTGQFIYISSASAYQKPLSDYRITEGTPLSNPYWGYSRDKIAGEEYLMGRYREEGFPVTIVRPSHTYGCRSVPVGLHGKHGSFQVLQRMLRGKPVIIHGDGTSLWTLTHSRDFAEGFAGLVGNIHAIGEAVQITGDETLTWNQIYRTIAGALGVTLKPCYVSSMFLAEAGYDRDRGDGLLGDKAHSVVFQNDKLKRLVPGFKPAIRFDQGVREAIEYIFSHPECRREDPEFDAWCDQVVRVQDEALAKMTAYVQGLSP